MNQNQLGYKIFMPKIIDIKRKNFEKFKRVQCSRIEESIPHKLKVCLTWPEFKGWRGHKKLRDAPERMISFHWKIIMEKSLSIPIKNQTHKEHAAIIHTPPFIQHQKIKRIILTPTNEKKKNDCTKATSLKDIKTPTKKVLQSHK